MKILEDNIKRRQSYIEEIAERIYGNPQIVESEDMRKWREINARLQRYCKEQRRHF